jgi:hypothetical protein
MRIRININPTAICYQWVKLFRYRHADTKVERAYISDSFLTSALDGSEWSASLPGRTLPPGKDLQYPLDRRLGGPQLVLTQKLEEKSSASAKDGTPVVHSAFSQTLY